jgi:hypothetical protein
MNVVFGLVLILGAVDSSFAFLGLPGMAYGGVMVFVGLWFLFTSAQMTFYSRGSSSGREYKIQWVRLLLGLLLAGLGIVSFFGFDFLVLVGGALGVLVLLTKKRKYTLDTRTMKWAEVP